MTIAVCTGFSPHGYIQYGRRFLETFDKFWSKEIELKVYIEEPVELPRGQICSLWDCSGAADFYWTHKEIPEHCGKAPTSTWRRKEYGCGYSWRQDALKFFRQCLIPEHAAETLEDNDILVWLDADIVTFAEPPKGFPQNLFNESDLVFLGRFNMHSEIGFWAVKLNADSRRFLFNLANIYRSGRIFEYKQFHSAFAFDIVRREAEQEGLKTQSIVARHRAVGHVWFESVLGEFSDHLKGNRRKRMGFSPERKLRLEQSV